MTEKRPPPWTHFVAGGTGAMVGALSTCPLEVVKTRLQALQNKDSLRNHDNTFGTRTFKALQALYQEQGLRSLYRGLMPHLMGVIPARSIYFGVFSLAKQKMEMNHVFDQHVMFRNWIAGASAGFATITATNPIWFIKTRMQLQTISTTGGAAATLQHYKSTSDCVAKVFRHEGPRAFFTGMGASYVGVSESSIQFMLYEKFKSMLQSANGSDEVRPVDTVVASSLAKLIASALTYPHEVVRTRLRELGARQKYKGFVDVLVQVGKSEGLGGLYGGLTPHLMRVVPNAALMFMTYELVIAKLTSVSNNNNTK